MFTLLRFVSAAAYEYMPAGHEKGRTNPMAGTVLILMDTLNRHFLKTYDRQAEGITPSIDEFSKDCVRFENHYIGSAPCMPARRDIFTGRMQFLERGWGGIEPFDITLPEILRENGIFTHITTDHAHYFETGGENYCQLFDTWDFHRGQETDPWISRVRQPKVDERAYGRKFPQEVLNRSVYAEAEECYPTPQTFLSACKWAEENKGCDDFFLMVESFDPHEPFIAPEEYRELYHDDYKGPEFNWPGYAPVTEPEDAVAHLKKSYLATLTLADRYLGKFLNSLKENGLYEDTLIILTTDHGHMLGEHGYTGKNYMHAYNEMARIPLYLKLPDRSFAGETRTALTQNIDLMPTILKQHGISVPDRVKGKNLFEAVERKAALREQVIYGWFGRAVNVCDGKYTYFRAPKSRENKPCYQYGAIPTTLNRFYGEKYASQMEMGRFLPYTDYPVYRIPVFGEEDYWGSIDYVTDSLLFDIEADEKQMFPVRDERTEAKMYERLIAGMKEAQSPPEQYERLGLV